MVQADKYESESLEIDGEMSGVGKGVGRGVRYLRRVANLIAWQLGVGSGGSSTSSAMQKQISRVTVDST